MRLIVVPYDKLVIKDGEGYTVDNLDYLDSNINAIQWYDDKGEIEYEDGSENTSITDITPYNQCLTDWDTAKAKYEEQIKEAVYTESDYEVMFRQHRNFLLATTDWTQANDSPLTDAKKTEWKTYRQALRDMPTNKTTTYQELANNLTHSDYPTQPS